MTAKIIIDDMEDSAIVDVEIRPSDSSSDAVAFNLDEVQDVVRVAINLDDVITSITIPAQSFWLAAVALARDNITTELEALTSGNDSK